MGEGGSFLVNGHRADQDGTPDSSTFQDRAQWDIWLISFCPDTRKTAQGRKNLKTPVPGAKCS